MLRLALLVGLLAILGQAVPAYAPPPEPGEPQFRAYWVDSFGPGLYSEAEIDQLVADTKAANMNAIIAQVVRRADCLCNRANLPRTEAEIDPYPFDPLQTLIEKAHAAGIEVHAWLNATIMWVSDTPPDDIKHIYYQHGPWSRGYDNWVMVRRDGARKGGELYYFDLGHPGAAEYIVNMYLDIVRHYDIDGINLDFIRYPEFVPAINIPTWGYNPVAVARFQAATGRKDVPEPTDLEWMAWRREQVTSIVRRVYVEAYAIKPHLRVSADTITWGDAPEAAGGWTQTRAYQEVLQDWRSWMEEGILDLNIPMNYRREQYVTDPDQAPMYDEWNRFIKDHQYNRHAAIGTGLFLNPIEDSFTQILKALTPNVSGTRAKGWVGYSYRTPDSLVDRKRRLPEEARQELTRSLTVPLESDTLSEFGRVQVPIFLAPAPVPTMPWKLQPTTGHVSGTVRLPDGGAADQVRVDIYNAATKAVVASRWTNGIGWFGFVDLSPGEYKLVTASASGTASTPITVVAGQVTPVGLILSR